MRRLLPAVVALLLLAPLATARAATLDAPSDVAVGEQLAVLARGLADGVPYDLALVAPAGPGSPSTCLARIGAVRRVRSSGTVLAGRAPRTLTCRRPDGTRAGSQPVRRAAAGYVLSVCARRTGALCDRSELALQRAVAVRSPGRRCRDVVLAAATEAMAFDVRAYATGCRRARELAAGTRTDVRRCFTAGRCAYRRARYACRGLLDDAALPTVVVRCTRGRARVTFART